MTINYVIEWPSAEWTSLEATICPHASSLVCHFLTFFGRTLGNQFQKKKTRSPRDSETETRMPSATDPSDPSYSSRCHLADACIIFRLQTNSLGNGEFSVKIEIGARSDCYPHGEHSRN